MKITATSLLTSAAQVIITIMLGAFMIINAAVIFFYVFDGYKNYQKKESVDVVMTGRIHHFDSLEFSTNPNGVQRHCVAVTANGRMVVREDADWNGSLPSGNFCEKLFNSHNINHWEEMAPTSNNTSIVEKLFWSFAFLLVFMTGAYFITTIPSNLVGILVPGLASLTKVMAMLLTLPVLVFWGVFVSSAWAYHPAYWKSPDGYTVKTEKVFITRDNRMFKAPETVFAWSNNDTMTELHPF